jgi:predicted small lipoprotein YifL
MVPALSERPMPFPFPPAGRAVLLAGALALALSACGRRGPLEPPGAQAAGAAPAAAGTTVEPEEERRQAGATIGSPAPGGRNAVRRGFTVPQQPFILDPLL